MMGTQGLYRKAALEALRAPSHSDVLLAQPISFHIFVAAALVIGATIVLYFIFGTYTQRETVSGYVAPASGVFRIYVPQPGVVLERFVRQGQQVRKGDRLIRISVDLSVSSLGETQAGVIEQVQHRKFNLAEELRRTHDLQVAKKEGLELSLSGLREQLSELDQVMVEDRERLEASELLFTHYEQVRSKGYMSEDEFLRKKEELLKQREDFSRLKMNRGDLDRQMRAMQLSLRNWPLEEQTAVATIDRQISELEQQLQESEAKRSLTVSATEDGVVAELAGDVGKLVQPIRPVAIIVPRDSILEVQLLVPGRSIGFVTEGSDVRLRYQAFPFEVFGQFNGTVKSISKSALSADDLSSMAAFTPRSSNDDPVYRVVVALEQASVFAHGQRRMLLPGMRVEADLARDTRRLYEWTLEPLYALSHK